MARRMSVYETTFLLGGKVNSSLGRAFGKAQGKMRILQKSAKYTDRSYDKLGRTMKNVLGAAGVYLGIHTITSQLKTATDKAMEFNDQMTDVGTLLDDNISTNLAKASKETKKLAIQTGISTKNLNEGYYETVSAIGDTANSYEIFKKAAENAKAGNTDVNNSVKFLSVNMKGYGDISQNAAQKISDLGFETVKLGQTTFPELATNMGKVIPLASSIGVKMESVYGAMATLTGVIGNTSEVSTALRGVFKSFVKPSADMQKAIHSLGYSSGNALIKAKGLKGSLNLLSEATGGSKEKIASLFGEVESLNAVLALTGAQSDTFDKKIKAMYKSVGLSNKVFEQKVNTSKSLRNRFAQLINVTEILAGNRLLPVINKGLIYILDNSENIAESSKKLTKPLLGIYNFVSNNWSKIAPIVVGVTAAYTANKLALLGLIVAEKTGMIISGLTKAWNMATVSIQLLKEGENLAAVAQLALNTAMEANPIGLVITGIGLLVGAGYMLYKNWNKISNMLYKSWDKISTIADKAILSIKVKIAELMKHMPNFLLSNGAKKWKKKFIIEYEEKHSSKVNKSYNGNNIPYSKELKLQSDKSTPYNYSKLNVKNNKTIISKIPMFAKGINNFGGGAAIVGEEGPELVNLPRRSQVIPTTKTEKILNNTDNKNSKIETLLNNFNKNIVNKKTTVNIKWEPKINIEDNANEKNINYALSKQQDDFKKILIDIIGYDPRTSFSM